MKYSDLISFNPIEDVIQLTTADDANRAKEYVKSYDYLICNVGDSLDIKGENVMTHGGISLDEVVVPFIIARTEDYHG